MNILVTIPMGCGGDGFFTTKIIEKLESLGMVDWNQTTGQLTSEDLKNRLKNVNVCITGWGCPQMDQYVLENATELRLVAHTGGSVASLVSNYLHERGIKVISGNRLYAESVAEGTLAYMLCSLRDIPYYSYDVKNGNWQSRGFFNEGLLDQKIGLVGFGMAARYLVNMLLPFRAKIKVYDPYIQKNILSDYGVEYASMEEIFSTSKIISIHASKTPDTYHIINRRLLRMIPVGAILVNTSRGNIIDEKAMIEELRINRFKAILDVFEEEPLPPDSLLRKMDNVILIPHMAGPTLDRRKYVTMALIDDIISFFDNRGLKHEITREYAMNMTR